MEVLEAISKRKSVRAFKSTPVDDRTLTTILEAARQAPSWSNTQCWRFIVVQDDKTRAALADTAVWANNRGIESSRKAPVLIVACAEVGKAGARDGKFVTNKGAYWYMFDVALAMQNLVLAAQSFGLGTVYLGAFDADKAGAIVGLPEGFAVVAMTPLGYPDEAPAGRPRKELSDIVFYDKFGYQKK
jgi:nitroreductase